MRCSKKLFTVIAMVSCFSLCMGTVSRAESIKYTETKYGTLVNRLKRASDFDMCIDSTGRLVFNLHDYNRSIQNKNAVGKKYCARVVYTSKGKKSVNPANTGFSDSIYNDINYIYGDRIYSVVGSYKKKQKQLVVYTKKGEVVKRIKFNASKYLEPVYYAGGGDYGDVRMAEIINKNRVRLYVFEGGDPYMHTYSDGCGAMIEVNISTGKIKKLFLTDEFVPEYYDGECVYGCIIARDSNDDNKITFYRKSLKTGKIDEFTADAISYDMSNYVMPVYSFYKGKIMVLEPEGKLYYGDFDTKTFEQIDNLSKYKNFKNYVMRGFAMKSRNEFYVLYDPSWKKGIEPKNAICGKLFMVKYKG